MKRNQSILLIFWCLFSTMAYGQDVGISSINAPTTACDTGFVTVSVDVTNYGASLTLATIDLVYKLDTNAPVTQTQVVSSFNSNATQTYNFTVPINLSNDFGEHTIVAYTDFASDTDRSNDTLTETFFNYEPTDGGDLAANDTVCQSSNGDTLRLSNKVGDVQRWESNSGSGFMPIVNTDTFYVYSNIMATTSYRVLVQNGTCDEDYSSVVTIKVDTPAMAGTLASDDVICFGDDGDTLRLTGYDGTIAYWEKNEGSGWQQVSNTDDTLIYGSLTTTTSYRVVVERGVCDADTSNEVTITVLPQSDGGVLAPSAQNVCAYNNGDTILLSGKTGDVVQWELSDDMGFTWSPFVNTDTIHVYNNLSQTRWFRVLVKFQNCPSDYSTISKITADSAAFAGTLEEDKQVCAGASGDTLNLVDHIGDIVKWQKNESGSWVDIANTSTQLVYPAPTVTTKYRVIVAKGTCPNDTSNIVTVAVVAGTVGGKLAPNFIQECAGINEGTIYLMNSMGNIQQWEFSDDNGSTWVPSVNTADSQNYSNLSSTRLYRVLVEADGCPSAYSDTAQVEILPQPDGGFVFEDKSICGGTNKDTLILKDYTGTILKWQQNSSGTWMDIANTSDTLFVNSILQTTSYRAIVGNAVCENDTSEMATLTIIATTYGGEIEKSDSVCLNNNAGQLVLKNHIGDIRWWEQSTNNGVTWIALANSDTVQAFSDISVTTMYRVLVEGTNCPNDYSDTATLTPYLPPVLISTSGPTSFCDGDSVELQATDGYPTYAWSTGSTDRQITATSSGEYKVTITDRRGCSNSDSVTVTVFDLPMVNAGDDQTISLGATTMLQATGAETYLWQPGASLSDSTIANPFATPFETKTYTVTGTDNNGCVNSDDVLITVLKDYNFDGKNLITPNGDGANDVWEVDNIVPYEDCKVTIVNRYGDIVYEQQGYKNSWDGTNNGKRVSDGTYYYIIQCTDSDKIFKGHITLLTK